MRKNTPEAQPPIVQPKDGNYKTDIGIVIRIDGQTGESTAEIRVSATDRTTGERSPVTIKESFDHPAGGLLWAMEKQNDLLRRLRTDLEDALKAAGLDPKGECNCPKCKAEREAAGECSKPPIIIDPDQPTDTTKGD